MQHGRCSFVVDEKGRIVGDRWGMPVVPAIARVVLAAIPGGAWELPCFESSDGRPRWR